MLHRCWALWLITIVGLSWSAFMATEKNGQLNEWWFFADCELFVYFFIFLTILVSNAVSLWSFSSSFQAIAPRVVFREFILIWPVYWAIWRTAWQIFNFQVIRGPVTSMYGCWAWARSSQFGLTCAGPDTAMTNGRIQEDFGLTGLVYDYFFKMTLGLLLIMLLCVTIL